MSRFLNGRFAALEPYVPGEQPQDKSYIKLNTNESPFPPSPTVVEAVSRLEVERLNLYSDPTAKKLVDAVAAYYTAQVNKYGKDIRFESGNVFVGNGSDEVLSFAFQAFCGRGRAMAFPEIGYGFYPVFCKVLGIEAIAVKINDDFSVNVKKFDGLRANVTIANPNAQTGIYLETAAIRALLEQDENRLVVVDEAYCDFGGETAAQLLDEFDNLLVVGTLSKSRQLAGGRAGFAIGSKELISDLNKMKYSFNPYNMNRLSIAAASAAFEDTAYFERTRRAIMDNRTALTMALTSVGFKVLPSRANFVLCKHAGIGGKELYSALKDKGVLVRFLSDAKLAEWVRITVGSEKEISALIAAVKDILKEKELSYESNIYNENDERNGY